MAKLLATAAILAIFYFVVVVNATSNCHITTTTTTTTIDEEKTSTSSLKTCEEDINGKDFTFCNIVLAGSIIDLHANWCCNELRTTGDIPCQCVALNKLIKQQEENGQDSNKTRKQAAVIVQYCRMGTPATCLRNAALSSIIKNHI